ncbi:M55 family metallopeptidase, partial [Streptomyces sp. PU-14G]|uniref:M55 family metallopeptidase n=1 Tax=Streptomyces sp. PU-14G TaxID=2800808 RepID=UPI0034DF88DC
TLLANSLTGVWADGVRASEGYLNSLVTAEYGVPIVLVTGDDRTVEDAKGYAPEAKGVAVKDYVSRYAAVCRPPARTAAEIRDAARRAAPLAVRHTSPEPEPHTIEIEFDAEHLVGAATVVPGVARTAERRVSYTSPSAYEAIRCFKAVTTVVSSAVEEQYG